MNKKKVTLYLNDECLGEIREEAKRQDRSLSWIVQAAWRLGRTDIKNYPGTDDLFRPRQEEET